jgi:hypothetical protein
VHPIRWHILTGEYEPQPGGVSDYTALVARGLAQAGDEVHVWTPSAGDEALDDPGVTVHRLPDHFGPRALTVLTRQLRADDGPPRRVLVQYVPQAFGWKGSNLAVCLWLRALGRESIWVMFHEVAHPVGRDHSWLQNGLGLVTHRMAALVAGSAERVFVSTPAWTEQLRMLCRPGTPITWLPVPSAIPVEGGDGADVRARYAGHGQLVGHFGTCGSLITPLLFEALGHLAHMSDARFLLFGRGSDLAAGEAARRWPALAGRIDGTGALTKSEVSRHLAACDVMLQPYPDGVTSRRTSVMAALAHGRPVVTTTGPLTEPLWRWSAGVRLAAPGNTFGLAADVAALLGHPDDAYRLSQEALATYRACFDLRHTITALRGPDLAQAYRSAS